MTKKEIKFRDPVVEHVVDKFVERSDVGFKKYKQTESRDRQAYTNKNIHDHQQRPRHQNSEF